MQKISSKNYRVRTIDLFEKQAKRLIKKYPSLLKEIDALTDKLAIEPFLGESLGNDCYKIRIAIQSKGRGKSGGGRIISNVIVANQEVFLLTIYDKSEADSITEKQIENLLKRIPQ